MKVLEWEEAAAKIWNNYCNHLHYIYESKVIDAVVSGQEVPEFSSPEAIMDYRFGHIVWADFNYESYHIKWCIDQAGSIDYDDMLDFEKSILIESLQKLLNDLPKYEDCEDYE